MAQVNSVANYKKPEGALDAIVRALQGYQAFTGARENVAKTDAMQAAQEREDNGVLDTRTKAELAARGATFSQDATPGAFKFAEPDPNSDSGYTDVYIKPPSTKAEIETPLQALQRKKLEQELNQGGPSITPYQKAQLELENKKLQAAADKQDKEKQPNKDQFQAALFGRRVQAANDAMDQLASTGFDRSTLGTGIKTLLPNSMQSAELQQQNQAERNFVNAVLRRESGAAISSSEFDSAEKQYFPRAGDSPEVLAQKKQNREQVLAGLSAEAGNAWDQVPAVKTASVGKKAPSNTAFAAPASPNKLSSEDEQALSWANANPKDPRAIEIKKRLGVQ